MLGVVIQVTPSSALPPCETSRASDARKRLLSDMDQLVTFLVFEPAE